MFEHNGLKGFGFFEGSPYEDGPEDPKSYEKYQNRVDKQAVLRHFDSMSPALTSAPTYDVFTGEEFQAGVYRDGVFVITTDFVRYYRSHDWGIPYEYEDYLVENGLV